MTIRNTAALFLSALLLLALFTACGDGSSSPAGKTDPPAAGTEDPGNETENPPASYDEHRVIRMATWYDMYYFSNHTDVYDNPKVSDTYVAELQLENIRAIEERYNVEFLYSNMTWEGVIESINTSIMAKQPDVDIYLTDLQFGIPAVLNGYAQPLSSFTSPDSDIFTDQKVMQYLNFMDMPETYFFSAASAEPQSYFLGFNLDMVLDEGLEDPRDLFDRGEWTWDTFRDYLKRLTKDTDSDNVTDIYGYSGVWTNFLKGMLLSNNAQIAGSTTQGLDSANTLEVLTFINELYNVDRTARPWDSEGDFWGDNNDIYQTGNACFFVGGAWLLEEPVKTLPFEIGAVPWPLGPQGDPNDRRYHTVSGNWSFIPTGVEDPKRVYDVYFDFVNWFDSDVTLRDDLSWWQDCLVSERNFDLVLMMTQSTAFDIWDNIGINLPLTSMLDGTVTPAQLAEENKLLIQDALDMYFK